MDVRDDFPILKRKINGKPLVYLDNAATTQKPVQVLDAVDEFYKGHHANLGRGVHTLALETTEIYEDARKRVAGFINAKPEEIVFTNNTTQGLNMVAHHQGKELVRFNEVVTTVMEHHSNYVPWKLACELSKAKLRMVDITDDGRLDMKDFQKSVNKNTRVVAATHVSNVLGTVNPVSDMVKIAHENGAVFVLDGAQSVAHQKTDVKKLKCDFMAFSGHKMLAPMGIGVLYGQYDLLEDMDPDLTGGGMVERTYPSKITFLKTPRKFEAGTQNAGGAVGLAAAIDYLERIGMDKVQKHEDGLTKYALENMGGVKIYGPKERAGIISFNIPGISSEEIATIMDEQGIAIRSGQHCAQPLMHRLKIDGCARMSFYLYNTKDELEYTLGILRKIKDIA